ncbi:hypothetical protein C8R48DRAFT_733775 [Suillus tomentosus]|nr:hypothetical protein C8R48DRAFT_733775 [Suillus tomentosus]
MLHQLYDIHTSCVGFDGQIMPSLEEKASACLMAIGHLYCGRVLQAHPTRGEFLGCSKRDYDTFSQMTMRDMDGAHRTVLATTKSLCFPQDEDRRLLWFSLYDCPGSVAEWLSHSLPYHFVTGRANEDVEIFAIEVISKLLSSPSFPSNQILANCALLACVMVGVQFDKKDIVRIDKSSALPRFANALVEQFQTTLWAWYGGDLSDDNIGVAPSWAGGFIKIICLALESAKKYYYPLFPAMRNLDVCRKIYSRVRSSEQNPPWELLDALRNALRFTLAAAKVSQDPADLWNSQHFWIGDSHSPEDFDWLVDYLEYIDSYNQEAVFEILLLLVVMKVRCSAAKQNQFFKCLIACMGSDMPVHLRHAALRLAHSAREEMVSIDAIDLDQVLPCYPDCNFSAARCNTLR